MIPSHFHTHSALFTEIRKITETTANDMDLGKAIRKLIQEWRDGKWVRQSGVELDKPRFTDDYIQ